VETTVGNIVGCSHGHYSRELQLPGKAKAKRGTLHVDCEEISTHDGKVDVQWSARDLDKKDWGPFAKSDPFLELVAVLPSGREVVAHRTEHIRKTLKPSWARFDTTVAGLCNGNYDREIKLKVWDWNHTGTHSFIGAASTTMAGLQEGSQEFELINPKYTPSGKKPKKGYKHSGILRLDSIAVKQFPSFVELLGKGLEINFEVAIDFTQSNGDVKLPSSLHYINPHYPNEYTQALQAVGKVLEDYDSDQLFPALGYGGLVGGVASHCFSLTGDLGRSCHGVDGVIAAYQHSLQTVALWGPTNFSPVIEHVTHLAMESHRTNPGMEYHVLMIVTDGIITDMGKTVETIVTAAAYPLSIIIVGVGKADFDSMETLDGDDVRLKNYRGEAAVRDIVQFVPFRDFKGDSTQLAREVLHELPGQVVDYFVNCLGR